MYLCGGPGDVDKFMSRAALESYMDSSLPDGNQ